MLPNVPLSSQCSTCWPRCKLWRVLISLILLPFRLFLWHFIRSVISLLALKIRVWARLWDRAEVQPIKKADFSKNANFIGLPPVRPIRTVFNLNPELEKFPNRIHWITQFLTQIRIKSRKFNPKLRKLVCNSLKCARSCATAYAISHFAQECGIWGISSLAQV